MRNKIKGSSSESGFTLLEVLLAIFIFAIVMTTLFGSFNNILSSVEIIEENLSANESAKTCLNRMITDLQAIKVTPSLRYTKPDFNSDPDIHRIVGEVSSTQNKDFPKLRFTSSAHVSFGIGTLSGIAEIVYYVSETDDNKIILKRSDRTNFAEPREETDQADPVLCEKVKSLVFKYYDKEGTEHESWDSESSEFNYETPASIGIRLEIGDESGSNVFQTRVHLPVYRFKT